MQFTVKADAAGSRLFTHPLDRGLRLNANAREKISTVLHWEKKRKKKMKAMHHFQVGYIHNTRGTFFMAVDINNVGNNFTANNAYSLRVSMFPYEN